MRDRDVAKLCYRKKRETYTELWEGCFLEILKTSISINSVIFLLFTVSSHLLKP